MAAGPFDRYIAIEMPTITRGPTGQPIEAWATFVRMWMGKRDIRGRERLAAGEQELASEATVWTGQWIDGVTPDMRLVDGDKIYNIHGIAEIGRYDEIELTATVERLG